MRKNRKLSGAVAAAAMAVGLPLVLTATPAAAADTDIRVTEVNPRASDTPLGDDWVELTNVGTTAVDLTGWRVDDDGNSFAAAGVVNGVTSIAPGESIILVTEAASTSPAAFRTQWWGASPPATPQVGWLAGSGLGLGSGGDQVNVFNSTGTRVANVSFGSTTGSPPYKTLENNAGVNGAIALRSEIGVNGAFQSSQGGEIGSPGLAGAVAPDPVVPEFPLAVLGLLSAGGVLAGGVLLSRRRGAVPAF